MSARKLPQGVYVYDRVTGEFRDEWPEPPAEHQAVTLEVTPPTRSTPEDAA